MLDCCVVVFVTFALFAKISFFFFLLGGGGGQMVGLCCGGGWQRRGICKGNAELVIVGIWGRVQWAGGGG